MDTCDVPRGTRCCQWESQERWTTKMAKTIAIYARNVDTESDYGEMIYTLSCPVRESPACRIAKVLSNALSPGMGDALKSLARHFRLGRRLLRPGLTWLASLFLGVP